MKIGVPKETHSGEKRVALLPDSVAKLTAKGLDVAVEAGLGATCSVLDAAYTEAGASVVSDRQSLVASSDLVLRLRKPPAAEVGWMKKNAFHVSYLDPFNEKDLVSQLASAAISAVSMEMIPRTTLAQKMDALSSQASLAGYVAVVLAAERLNKIFPMMMTPAGTISPSKVFVIGAGVAGLQAIATAKRLGARVEAFDTRPVVKEQVESLGGKFVEIDLGETGQTKDGYAKALTDEQIAKQREGMKKHCAAADVVITTAQLFGRPAPVIVTKDMVAAMKPGSLLVDLAVETGGNVEGSQVDQEVDVNGVTIIGLGNLPGRVAVHASQMYSSNLTNFVLHFFNNETKKLEMNLEDEIMKGCLVTHGGQVVHPMLVKGSG